MTVDYRVGDVRDVMATIPDGSVSLVASSPPFLALRSYLPAGHDAKHAEIGSEPDPATFLDTLLALTAEWGRVLTPWGSIAIELGDTYSGSGGGGGDLLPGGLREGQQGDEVAAREHNAQNWRQKNRWKNDGSVNLRHGAQKPTGGRLQSGAGWPRAKCLALIPQLYATSLAYGRNILTGAESPAGQWLVRNVIVWHRPNPAVGALGDKFRPSTSYITVATRSSKRWFDLTAVRTPPIAKPQRFFDHGYDRGGNGATHDRPPVLEPGNRCDPASAPPLDTWLDHHDTWTLTTQPSSLAHYAMWPAKLAERLILSMCPLEVCTVCGEPRRRVEKATDAYAVVRAAIGDFKSGQDRSNGLNGHTQYHEGKHIERSELVTTGWTDCGHADFRPGLVLDPFAGTGTTLAVADLHGRDAIGIDIDARNRDLYPRRRDEVKKALYGTQPEMPGQLEMQL